MFLRRATARDEMPESSQDQSSVGENRTNQSSSYQDDDVQNRSQNASSRKSMLLLQKKELEEQLLGIEQQRRGIAAHHEATLNDLRTMIENLSRARQGLLQQCSQVEDDIRHHQKNSTIDAL